MTTLTPRQPYSKEELDRLYPKGLKLRLVQVFLRHGERSPVSARFQNDLLHVILSIRDQVFTDCEDWPYCNVARQMIQMAASDQDVTRWNGFQWRRKMETFGYDDEAIVSTGPGGAVEGICQHGELTDKGRETTFALGQRLRHLYVDQLGFMPKVKSRSEDMYLRSTPIPRALESLQQTFWGMYPPSARTLDFPPPIIVARQISDETLFPNEGNCRRFRQLARLFADRAAKRWNNSEKMDYLNTAWSKWMPEHSPRVAVDSHPRLSGVWDTINASDAHGPATKLPPEFYDKKAREYAGEIAVDEWFAGYSESNEYRRLGIGGLMGDIVDRMVSTAVDGGWCSETTPAGSSTGDEGRAIKFALSGCHDTTLAAILSSVGAFENGKWPPFTSNIAIELFSKLPQGSEDAGAVLEEFSHPAIQKRRHSGFLSYLLGPSTSKSAPSEPAPKPPSETARMPLSSFPDSARRTMQTHYVRIRYNDEPVRIPGCASKPRNHLPGDDTFCTLDAFKEIVDKFTPVNWREDCSRNLGEGMFGKDGREKSLAGF